MVHIKIYIYLAISIYLSVLYWISGTSGRSIVHGSWARHEPRTLIPSTNLNNPRSLQYDVKDHRFLVNYISPLTITISLYSERYQMLWGFFFNFRLYWLDNTIIKSATTNGSDIKSHIDTGGATMAFSYKVIFFYNNILFHCFASFDQNLPAFKASFFVFFGGGFWPLCWRCPGV